MKSDRGGVDFIDLIISIQLKLGYGEVEPPQSKVDIAEKWLRDALQTGKARSFLFDFNENRTEIPSAQWSEQDFWDAAHTDPVNWKGQRGSIVLDRNILAIGDIPAPFAEERRWIEQAPETIKPLMLYKYLTMMLEFWLTITDKPSTILRHKNFVLHMEKYDLGWSSFGKTEKDAFYHVIRPLSPYSDRGKQVQRAKNAEPKQTKTTSRPTRAKSSAKKNKAP